MGEVNIVSDQLAGVSVYMCVYIYVKNLNEGACVPHCDLSN